MKVCHFIIGVRGPAAPAPWRHALNDESEGGGRGAPSPERDWKRKYGLRKGEKKVGVSPDTNDWSSSSCCPLIDREDWAEEEKEEERRAPKGQRWVRRGRDLIRATAPFSLGLKMESWSVLKQNVTAGCSSSSIIKLLYVRRMQCAPPLPSLFLFQANEDASSEENKSFLFIPHRSSRARESLLRF